MEVHIWGPFTGDLPSFDPECLALLWYIQLSGAPIKVIASNNVYMSKHQRLPALLDDQAHCSGYPEIIEYLENKGFKLPNSEDMSGSLSSNDIALSAYLQNLTTLTLWTLFANKKNYENFTRPLISDSVPFPMQYNLGISLHRDAVARTEYEGITNKKTINAIKVPKEKGISKVHEQMVQESRDRQKSLKGAQQTMQVITVGEKLYGTFSETIPESLTPATLLLGANMCLQTIGDLKERPLERVIDSHPNLLELKARVAELSLPVVHTEWDKSQYNLENWLLSWTQYSRWPKFDPSS